MGMRLADAICRCGRVHKVEVTSKWRNKRGVALKRSCPSCLRKRIQDRQQLLVDLAKSRWTPHTYNGVEAWRAVLGDDTYILICYADDDIDLGRVDPPFLRMLPTGTTGPFLVELARLQNKDPS